MRTCTRRVLPEALADRPWHLAKKEINDEIKDLTTLWRVSPKVRPRAIERGITRHDDSKCCAEMFGLSEGYTKVLDCVIASQREGAPLVSPERIATDREEWHSPRPLEFYVDFETVSDLDDDFAQLPAKGGQPLIFMIGCGHIKDGEWTFECFIADRMTEPAEKVIIDAWVEHMIATCARFDENEPFVIHWSPHEKGSLTTAFNAARVRHPDNNWPEPNWFDFLNRVVKKEPVTVKGAYAFGLKAIAKALHSHDLIRTRWTDGPGDGLAAMVGGWWCGHEAERNGCCMSDLDLMKSIRDYNEVDCKVMWEAISYLRANH